MKKTIVLLLIVLLTGCAALPAETGGGSVLPETPSSGRLEEGSTFEGVPAPQEPALPESPPQEPDLQNTREVVFSVEKLRNDPVPVLNVPYTVVDTVSCGEHVFTVYQTGNDLQYDLFVTVDGVDYDLGTVRNGAPAADDMEAFKNSVIRLVQVPGSSPVYVLRSTEYMLVTTTYFTVRNGIPVILYAMEDLRSSGSQSDIDLDGEEETICNHGGTTSPNEWLYEWDLTAGEVHIADLREQLGCDCVIYDAERGRFVAETRLENGWSSIEYLYRDGCITEVESSVRYLQG